MTVSDRLPKLSNPWVRNLVIGLVVLILVTLFLAPNTERGIGSTYSRAPDGYGAWYAFMQERGTPVQRWQRPMADLLQPSESAEQKPITLLRVFSSPFPPSLIPDEVEWLKKGNRLVLLGIHAPVTKASFSTTHASDAGTVKIETRRRLPPNPDGKVVLGDRYGAIAQQFTRDQGHVTYVVPYYLAANAYQDDLGNFNFLAQLMTQGGQELWVDEYIHGYTQPDQANAQDASAADQNWVEYLAKTPVLLVFIQLSVLFLVLLFAENQRFGTPTPLTSPTSNNSRAYIDALATVLHKAESSEFVLELIGREEQLHIQKALGLGSVLLESQPLLAAWTSQTGRPSTELEPLLRPYWRKQRMSEVDLVAWIEKIQAIHQHLPR
jgi:hypothetical protein